MRLQKEVKRMEDERIHLREYIHCHEQNVTRNVSIKGTFGKTFRKKD